MKILGIFFMANSCQTKPSGIKALMKSWFFWKPALGVLIGAIAGFLYYHFIGCNGTCAITGDPLSSIIFGGLLGLFIVIRPCSTC